MDINPSSRITQQTAAKTNNLKILLLLSLGHLATDLNQGALPVILPLLKSHFQLSYAIAGIIPLVSNLSSSVIQPLFGMLSDKYKCIWLLPLGCFAAALGIGMLGIIDNYLLTLLLILITGFGIAAFHPEGAKVAHFAAGGQRASAMSVFSVGGNLGFAFGSLVMAKLLAMGGLPYSIYMLIPGSVVALLFLANLRSIPQESQVETKTEPQKAAQSAKIMPVLLLIGVVVVRSWVQYGLSYYIPFYYINYLKTDQLFASNVLFVYLLAGAIGTLAGGPLSDYLGRKKVITGSMLLMPPLLLTFIFAKSVIISMVVLFIAGTVLVSTFSTTIVLGQEFMPNNVGIASGLMIGLAVGTGGIGLIVLGALADATSEHVAMVAIALLPLVGAILSCMLPKEAHGKEGITS